MNMRIGMGYDVHRLTENRKLIMGGVDIPYEKGLLGNPICMEAEYLHWELPGSNWSKELTKNGDWRKLLSPIRYCTHSLGPLLAILTEELRKVSCFGTGPHDEKSSKDDMMCAQFQTDSGVVIRLMRNGRIRSQIGHHNYRVFGTEGFMERMDMPKFWDW